MALLLLLQNNTFLKMSLKISITLFIDAHIIEKMGRGAPHVPPRKTLKNLAIKIQCKLKKRTPSP